MLVIIITYLYLFKYYVHWGCKSVNMKRVHLSMKMKLSALEWMDKWWSLKNAMELGG